MLLLRSSARGESCHRRSTAVFIPVLSGLWLLRRRVVVMFEDGGHRSSHLSIVLSSQNGNRRRYCYRPRRFVTLQGRERTRVRDMAPATLRHGGGFGWTGGVDSGSCGWRLTVELTGGERQWMRPHQCSPSACRRHWSPSEQLSCRVAAIASPLDRRHHAREIWWFAGDQPWVAGKSFTA
nr:hypothetical protein Iba_chr02fCG8770 [Ipomoea batatas]